MFGKTDYTASVREALKQMLADTEVTSSVGAAKFTRSDKKTVGHVYLREGKVYAVDISSYTPNIMTRLVQNGYLNEEAVAKISRHFGKGKENDPRLPEFCLDRHLVPEKAMATIQQDFFLEAFSYILSWTDVHADWRQGEVTDFYKIDRFELQKVIDLTDTREVFLDKVSKDFGVDKENFDKITFRKITEPELDEETPLIYHQLLSVANGEWDVRSTVNNFGLTYFRTVQSIHDLWTEKYINLFYEGYPIAEYASENTTENAQPLPEENIEENTVSEPYEENNSTPFAAHIEDGEVEIDLDDTDTVVPEILAEEIETVVAVELEQVSEQVEKTNLENSPNETAIDKLIKELSHEMELLRIKVQEAKTIVAEKEELYETLGEEIKTANNNLSTLERQYNRIVSQIDAMR